MKPQPHALNMWMSLQQKRVYSGFVINLNVKIEFIVTRPDRFAYFRDEQHVKR